VTGSRKDGITEGSSGDDGMRKTIVITAILLAACSGDRRTASGPTGVTATADGGYDRTEWKHWTDADHDCQDTRQEVLVRQSEVPVTFKDLRQCSVASGRWTCPYTGQVFTDPSQLDIDHVVGLKEAYDTGGAEWDAARKEAFANDLDDPELLAVSASANRSKGDRGPEEWMPPWPQGRCPYLKARIRVQLKWGLTVPEAESRAVLGTLVEECTK